MAFTVTAMVRKKPKNSKTSGYPFSGRRSSRNRETKPSGTHIPRSRNRTVQKALGESVYEPSARSPVATTSLICPAHMPAKSSRTSPMTRTKAISLFLWKPVPSPEPNFGRTPISSSNPPMMRARNIQKYASTFPSCVAHS